MNSLQKMIQDFHEKYGHPVGKEPITDDWQDKLADFRRRLHNEEYVEFSEEVAYPGGGTEVPSVLPLLKEAADLVVVGIGTFVATGWDAEVVIGEVMRSNMSKDPEGPDKKPSKGPDYSPADLMAALDRARGQEGKAADEYGGPEPILGGICQTRVLGGGICGKTLGYGGHDAHVEDRAGS